MQLPRRNSVAMEYSLAFEQTDGTYFYVSASQLYTPKKGDTKIPLLLYVCRLFLKMYILVYYTYTRNICCMGLDQRQ